MKIFISWSGEKSRLVAEKLRAWLPMVLAGGVECFVSSQDIRRGDRGLQVIAGELDERDYGIVVLTADNMSSPWVNFEAGALGKSLGEGKVAPLLLDLTRVDVEGPIAQFQNTLLTDKSDMRQFVLDLAGMNPGVMRESVEALFELKWTELEAVAEEAAGMVSPKTTRTTESMLEEVLEHVRVLRKKDRIASSDTEEILRLGRLSMLDSRHGGHTYQDAKGSYLEALDYEPSGDRVLVVMNADGVREWVGASKLAISPF